MKKFLLIIISLFSLGAWAEPYRVRSGDTLAKLLEASFTPAEIATLAREIKIQDPSFVLRVGMELESLPDEYIINSAVDKEIRIYREDEAPTVAVLQYEAEVFPTVITGTISANLFSTVKEIGEDAELAATLARMYEWEFDFFRDIRAGDSFKVLIEKKFVKGRYIGYGRILAADFVVQSKHHKAFYYDNGKGYGYYNEEGKALERGFLRVPLSYSRISSRFSNNRLHPVLGTNRAHYGVDYAAPKGTPVMATASGTVLRRSYTKSNGNFVELRHSNGYSTLYLHLSGFHKSLKVGAAVNQGQVIGYVGSTGYSTGPHLDYRIKHNGKWINPMNFIAEAPKLAVEDSQGFMKVAMQYEQTLFMAYQYVSNYKPMLLQ